MKRRDFLKILGIGTASVAFGLPSLATDLTPAQAEEAIALGDQFSVFKGFYGVGMLESGRGQIQTDLSQGLHRAQLWALGNRRG